MMKKIFTLGAALVLAGCAAISVVALSFGETTEFSVDGTRLLMTGEINSRTLDQFEEIYADNPQIRTLVELNVPGSADDETMIALAYRVRGLGLDTELRADSEIYSGGVDLFLAGVNRVIADGAVLGVHSWSDGQRDAADYPRNSPEHEMNRKYIEDMLGSDEFYWFTIYAAPADGIHVMTRAEIAKYGLATK